MNSAALRRQALDYLWEQFPGHCLLLTDPQTEQVIALGLQRAARHGCNGLDDLCRYLALMMFLGSEFDDDPRLPWVAPLLADRSKASVWLGDAAQALEPAIGARGEHYRRALLRARQRPVEWLATDAAADDLQALALWLRHLHPQRFDALPASQQQALLANIVQQAAAQGLHERAGLLTLGALVLLLGTGICRDPAHPWVAQTLALPAAAPAQRAVMLHAEALRQLQRYMALDRHLLAEA